MIVLSGWNHAHPAAPHQRQPHHQRELGSWCEGPWRWCSTGWCRRIFPGSILARDQMTCLLMQRRVCLDLTWHYQSVMEEWHWARGRESGCVNTGIALDQGRCWWQWMGWSETPWELLSLLPVLSMLALSMISTHLCVSWIDCESLIISDKWERQIACKKCLKLFLLAFWFWKESLNQIGNQKRWIL